MAANIYKTIDGKRVPSVTTILKSWGSADGLVYWAHNLGLEGKALDDARSEAAEPGTIAHEMIERYILGKDPTEVDGVAEDLAKARTAFEAFCRWADASRFELIESEVMLVSEALRFGGCLDALAKIHGRVSLFDWKSSGRVWAKFVAQVGGYALLVEETRDIVLLDAHVLRIGREHGEFAHHGWPRSVLETGMHAFRLAREMYDIDKTLKKVVGG